MHFDFTDSSTNSGRVANFARGFGGMLGFGIATLWFAEKIAFSLYGAACAFGAFICFAGFLLSLAYTYDSGLKVLSKGESFELQFVNYMGWRSLAIVVFTIISIVIVLVRYFGD
ncbi:hypothetical protein SAMN05444404_0372 [Ruegeria lacuscaerulensis ITI-1157]|nr:hypothetical protein SAMN05444404_0372 [Ruegeria lacuscaerulensis ITI-1157]